MLAALPPGAETLFLVPSQNPSLNTMPGQTQLATMFKIGLYVKIGLTQRMETRERGPRCTMYIAIGVKDRLDDVPGAEKLHLSKAWSSRDQRSAFTSV